MLRLFVGIELPVPVRQRLAALQGGYEGARWHGAEQLHLTLNFIGGFAQSRLPELTTVLQQVSAAPFSIGLAGVGYFGTPERPLLIWAGVTLSAALQQLQRQLALQLSMLGIAADERGYTPHITLARVRNGRSLAGFLERYADFECPAFAVGHICLFLSARGKLGAEYQVIRRFPLTERAC